MMMNIPKRVNVIVKRGENLEYISSLKKASKNRRWRVIFLGGADKLASEFVDEENGCPTWDCEVTLDLISPSDPVCLRVVDGDNHHIGQVNIPLNQVPQTGNPNFDLSRLCYSELEPTRKNSHPHGRLVYWIWAIDYWPPGTQANTIRHSKSLRGSLTNLSSKIRSKSKHKSKNDHANGYQSSELNGSSLQVPGMSYNPFENDGNASEFSGPMGLPPMYQSSNLNSPYAQSEFGGSYIGSTKSSKHKNIIKKFKSKISHSTQNLAEIAAKKAAGKDPYFQSLEKGSKSNLRGSQLSIGGTSYRAATSQLDLSRQTVNGNAGRYSSQSIYPRDDSGKSRVSASSFLDEHGVTTPIHQRTDGVGEVSAAPFESPGSLHLSTYGGQPDDRPNKPIEDMTKRETAEYVTQLLKSLQSARSEITRLQIENDRLTGNSHEFETQLNEVRTTLATLRNRLLEDNLTEYLELPHESSNYMGYGSGNFGGSFGGYMNSSSFDNSQHANAAIEPQSFLSKISSLSMNARLPNFISPMNSLHTNGSNTNSGGSGGGGGWW
ncbi:hypothetical protein MN116_008678 [Schistosoma mekongi]|uniref:C2 domain-containing protein n=1 Tax=Schistosoma mekongi TaxID=38744 RepID=A0AAE1Z5Q9_SCHME|nr:hypothetical protein MN116_008678 [Schistosoma mekongi]